MYHPEQGAASPQNRSSPALCSAIICTNSKRRPAPRNVDFGVKCRYRFQPPDFLAVWPWVLIHSFRVSLFIICKNRDNDTTIRGFYEGLNKRVQVKAWKIKDTSSLSFSPLHLGKCYQDYPVWGRKMPPLACGVSQECLASEMCRGGKTSFVLNTLIWRCLFDR